MLRARLPLLSLLRARPFSAQQKAAAVESIETELIYLNDAGKEFTLNQKEPSNRTEEEMEKSRDRRTMRVTNGRLSAESFSLDKHGFAHLNTGSPGVSDWDDVDQLREVYYKECSDIVAKATGALHVQCFGHIHRKPDGISTVEGKGAGGAYARAVHNDFTPRMGERIHHLMASRGFKMPPGVSFQIINLWRGMHRVDSVPLAMCDQRSVRQAELVPAPLFNYVANQEGAGEIYMAQHSDAHEWYYFPSLEPEECLLIKTFDGTDANWMPPLHTAVDDPNTPVDALPRESMEVRMLAFFPSKGAAGKVVSGLSSVKSFFSKSG